MTNKNSKTLKNLASKLAFTMAELMIVVAIIGVVAILTVPSLMRNIQEKDWNTSATVFETKLTESLKIMNSQGVLGGQGTTERFVEELQKHFKIAKVCENPMDCFEDNITWGEKDINLLSLKTSAQFAIEDWGTNVVGIQFANGTTGLLAYNPKCADNPYDNDTPVMDCIALMYDTTGFARPNKQSQDVRTTANVKTSGFGCLVETGDICVVKTVFTPTYLDCTKLENEKYCNTKTRGNFGFSNDYWAGARKVCEEVGTHLPNQTELTAIANDIYYPTTITSSGTTNATFNSEKAGKYGITSGITLWSSSEHGNGFINTQIFNTTQSIWSLGNDPRSTKMKAICIK